MSCLHCDYPLCHFKFNSDITWVCTLVGAIHSFARGNNLMLYIGQLCRERLSEVREQTKTIRMSFWMSM